MKWNKNQTNNANCMMFQLCNGPVIKAYFQVLLIIIKIIHQYIILI